MAAVLPDDSANLCEALGSVGDDARWYAGAGTLHGALSDHDWDASFATQFYDGSARTLEKLERGRAYRAHLAQRREDALARGETPPTRKSKQSSKAACLDPLVKDRLVQSAKSERQLAALRWKGGDQPMEILPADAEGFVVGGPVNGVPRPTLRIRGFRSREHESLGLYCARMPAGRKMRVGNSKNGLVKGGWYSCISRDEAYARMNDTFVGAICVEIDADFADIEEFSRRSLGTGLPWLPTLVVSLPVPGPEIIRPHLFFQLPHNKAVWNDPSNPRCRVAPRSLYRAVARGLTELLMPIGADPGGLSNPLHWKNPLSVRWTVATLERPVYPTLGEWAEARRCDGSKVLHLGASQEQMLRAKAASEAAKVGADATWSNSLFSQTRTACFAQIIAWKRADDPLYRFGVVDRERLCRYLVDTLEPRCSESTDPVHAAYVLNKVAPWVARAWNGNRDLVRVARGRDRHLVDAGMLIEERQAVAGQQSRIAVAARLMEEILKILRTLPEGPTSVAKAEISRRSGVSVRTVKRRWKEALEILERER